jgi:glycosyltransferase involved in cell wall biosynthesis
LKRIAFTICNYGYLFYALECERSFVEHHSGAWIFYIILVDHPAPSDSQLSDLQQLLASPRSRLLSIATLFRQSREISAMSLYYDITEFSTSVKPWIFAYFFNELSPVSATYIDPDIQFFASLDPDHLAGSSGRFDCMVTPHVLTDSLNATQQPTLQNIRACGSYNFGFVHFENTSRSRQVVNFWARQLVYNSLIWFEENLFTDQRFGDSFPSLCSVRVNRNPALNVAYWNIQERLVHTHSDGSYHVQLFGDSEEQQVDHPLVFFHYSSLRIAGAIGISNHMGRDPRTPRGANKTIEQLVNSYDKRLQANKRRLAQLSFTPMPSLIGSIGYEANGQKRFYELKAQERRQLNRFFWERAHTGWAGLPPSRFEDENAFLLALHGVGMRESSLIHCPRVNVFGAIELHLPGIDLGKVRSEPNQKSSSKAELNIVGYANFSFGIGRITGLILKGLNNAGVHFSFAVDPAQAKPIVDADLAWVETLPCLSQFNQEAPTLFLVNADQHLHYLNTGIAGHCFSKVCNLGYWWWELESPAPVHAEVAPYLDKVLAPTRFIYDSLSRSIPREKLIYAPLDYRELYNDIASEAKTGHYVLSDQEFLWSLGFDLDLTRFKTLTLNVFDFHSCIERKNPALLVDIFSDPSMYDHALIMKTSGGAAFPRQFQDLIERVASLPNVFLLAKRLSQVDLRQLFAICQIYVSPHRAEGLGLNIIEADAYGLSTVYTNYGGIMDYPFFGRGPHLPCPYSLVELSATTEVYRPYLRSVSESVCWAEPSREAFASSLRECMAGAFSREALKEADHAVQQSPSIIIVLTSMLHDGFVGKAAYQDRGLDVDRAPAALAVVPTLGDGKRQLYLACRQLLLVGGQGVVALRHLLNVIKLVVWLMLRQRRGLRRLYWAIVARRHYLRRPPSFRKLDVPPA